MVATDLDVCVVLRKDRQEDTLPFATVAGGEISHISSRRVFNIVSLRYKEASMACFVLYYSYSSWYWRNLKFVRAKGAMTPLFGTEQEEQEQITVDSSSGL